MSDNIPELEMTLQSNPQVESSNSRQGSELRVSTGPRYPSRVRRPLDVLLTSSLIKERRNCNKLY